jgi:hypothetical protein
MANICILQYIDYNTPYASWSVVVTVAKRRLFHMVRSMHHAQSFSISFLRRILCIQSPVLLPIDTQIEVVVS